MKNWYLFLLITFGLLSACSKSSDEDTGPAPPPPVNKSANLTATGASASDILSNDKYTTLRLELAYVRNFRPTPEAVNNLVSFLQQRSFKQEIVVEYLELDSPGEETLTLQEIANLESENRTAYNQDETLAVYIYFADAPAQDDDPDTGAVTLGAVYRNTSMVIHETTIRRLAGQSPLITVADVETATLTHEFGHLFGLVNLGSPEVNPHEDPDAENHCVVQGCLMRAELQFGGGMMSMLVSRAGKGLAVPGLDSECILDLQANGGR